MDTIRDTVMSLKEYKKQETKKINLDYHKSSIRL